MILRQPRGATSLCSIVTTGSVLNQGINRPAPLHINRRFTQHNHPSGCLTPSPDDNAVTKLIARAGVLLNIRLLDHVILAPDGGFLSYKNSQPEYLDGENH